MNEVKKSKKQHILSIILSITMIITIFQIMPDNKVSAETETEFNDGTLKYTVLEDSATVEVSGVVSGKRLIEEVTIPENVEYKGDTYTVISIGDSAFYKCTKLKTVIFKGESQLRSIGVAAFQNCRRLTSITIPNSINEIKSYTFDDCRDLTSITIPDSVKTIGISAFEGCISLTSITIPKYVTSISHGMFNSCVGLTSISIPSGVTNIGAYAFEGCINLTSINIPENVTNIGNFAFSDCKKLGEVNMPKGVNVDINAFNACNILIKATDLLPNNISSIGVYSWEVCIDDYKVQRFASDDDSATGYVKVEATSGNDIEKPKLIKSDDSNIQIPLTQFSSSNNETIYSFKVPTLTEGSYTDTYNLEFEQVAKPTFSVEGGTYNRGQTVTITSDTKDATIYYTIDGKDPTKESNKYSEPIKINDDSTTLKAIAVKEGMVDSDIETAEYNIKGVPESISIKTGLSRTEYVEGEKIDLSELELEIKMSDETVMTVKFADFVKYAIEVNIKNGTILNKEHTDIIISLGDKQIKQSIQVKAPSEAETVSTPTFSKEAGQYKEKQTVEIHSATEGATIYYTTDGSTPSESSTVYKGAIEIGEYTELKVIAVKEGMNPSKVSSGVYIINTKSYKILNTNGSLSEDEGSDTIEWIKGQDEELKIRLDGDINKFVNIMINGEILDKKYYTLESGSTIIKLKKSYIDTLNPGQFSLMANYKDGSIEIKFAVSEKPNEISEDTYTFSETNAKQQNESLGEKFKTGDNSNSLVWLSIIILASEAMIILIYKNKKSSKYNV